MKESRVVFKKLLEVDEALSKIFNELGYLLVKRVLSTIEEVSIYNITGRLIAEDIVAPRSLPWYPRSLVDGCAVRSADVQGAFEDRPVDLIRLGRVKIGERPKMTLRPQSCVEVDTGAWIPPGADAIVPIEHYLIEENKVLIERAVPPGNAIAMPASDVADGDIIVTKGTPTNPYLAGVLASLGLNKVKASRRIKVAVFSTGDELLEPGLELSDSYDPHIYDSNRPYLINEFKSMGWEAIDLGIVNDDEKEIEETIIKSINKYDADLIVSSGGTSAGIEDYVYRVVNKLGRVIIHGLRLKPGKPTVIGLIENRLFIGLPGNPRSCMNVMEKFVKPLLVLLGVLWPEERIATAKARVIVPASGEKGRHTFLPVALLGDISYKDRMYAIVIARDSYMVGSFAMSDGMITVSAHRAEPLRPFEEVTVEFSRFARCNLLVLSDIDKYVLNKALTLVRSNCSYVKIVISPFMIEGLEVLRDVYLLARLNVLSRLRRKVNVIKEFRISVTFCKKSKGPCEKVAIPTSFSDHVDTLRNEGKVDERTLAILVPRAKSAELLLKDGYVDCAITLSRYNDQGCDTIGEEKLLLAKI